MTLLSNNTPEKRPNPEISLPIDWSTTPVAATYQSQYLKIVDDVFSDEECEALKALATSDAQWAQAAVHFGLGKNDHYVKVDYRNSDRILRFDHQAAQEIFERLKPYVADIAEIKDGSPYSQIIWNGPLDDSVYRMVGLNDRLSFLRYGPGHFFKTHCDSLPELPDGRLGKVTIQIYLGDECVQGGATRIWGNKDTYFDVEPKKGRVLIFQHRHVYHSGEEVTSGLKFTLRSDLMYRCSDDS
ncbi:hypothetical protein CVT24_006430 [Panaeolus cyanescens]|uniref:Prolyl 4-hydroxylase alpha subunit domain-containing protein n=1 Tax=Panaeolus cyanescens TaxID=181874 RepID=A0A409VZ94_9AGAR|nr:hypothetical protein CVT24_006430 [Panaeolus cyanescens]